MPTPRKNADRTMSNAERQAEWRRRQKEARLQELEAKGLPRLPAIATMPGTQRWAGLVAQAQTALQTAHDEMEAYFEERSEEWQESDRGDELKDRIEAIESLLSELENV